MTQGMDYLINERGLPVEVLLEMGVAERNHPALGDSVAFPYIRGGKPYAAKFRSTSDTVKGERYRASKDITRGLYNEDALNSNFDQPVVITEGEIDCITMIAAGYPRTISLPDGWDPKGGGKLGTIMDNAERIRRSPYVIVAGDCDHAGISLAQNIMTALKGHTVKQVSWPEGSKDANEVWCRYGQAEINTCVSMADVVDPPGGRFMYIGDAVPPRQLIKLEDETFAKIAAFEIGQISVLTGRPGHGKTTFATFLSNRVRRSQPAPVGLLCMETSFQQLQDHIVLIECGTRWSEMTIDEQAAALTKIGRSYVLPQREIMESGDFNLAWLRDMLETLVLREGCRFIVIDPWNELDHTPEPGETMTRYVNWALTTIRNWADELQCHIMIVAHPTKISDEKSVPTGYAISDSAAFFNKAALGISIQENRDEAGSVECKIWKVRDRHAYGVHPGTVDLQFDLPKQVYRRT